MSIVVALRAMAKIINRNSAEILQVISRNSDLGVRDLAKALNRSTKTIVSAAKTFENLGFISYDYVKVSEVGRPKSVLKLTKAGKDFLRLSRLLNMRSEGLLGSDNLGQYYRFMGLDPLEVISRLDKYFVSGLFALMGETYDFIPSVRSLYVVVDPSREKDMRLISNWFFDYVFISRFEPVDDLEDTTATIEERNKVYEIKEVNCLETDRTIVQKVATTERGIIDSIADFELDPGAAIQATYILLENRYLDYTRLKDLAEQRGKTALSRIGFIFNLANEMIYDNRSSFRFPETFPTNIEYDAGDPFTTQVRGAIIRVFNLH